MKTALAVSVNKTSFAPVFFGGDIMNALRKTKEYGYGGAEISVCDPALLDWESIKKLLDIIELPIVTIATGQSFIHDGLCLYSDDGNVVNGCVHRIKQCVELAVKWNSKYVTIGGIRGKNNSINDRNKTYDKMVSAIAQCSKFAYDNGVSILIEPVNHYEVSTVYSIEEAIKIVQSIGDYNVKVLYDTYHANMEEASRFTPVYSAGKLLGHVHFADNNRMVPGFGCFDFTEVIRTLKAIDYNGYICVEALPLPDDESAAKKAINYLNALIG